ncbi:hypothetical protein Tco_0325203 [Tanacetum coccineum]
MFYLDSFNLAMMSRAAGRSIGQAYELQQQQTGSGSYENHDKVCLDYATIEIKNKAIEYEETITDVRLNHPDSLAFVQNCNVTLRAIMTTYRDIDDCISTTEVEEMVAKLGEDEIKNLLMVAIHVRTINSTKLPMLMMSSMVFDFKSALQHESSL